MSNAESKMKELKEKCLKNGFTLRWYFEQIRIVWGAHTMQSTNVAVFDFERLQFEAQLASAQIRSDANVTFMAIFTANFSIRNHKREHSFALLCLGFCLRYVFLYSFVNSYVILIVLVHPNIENHG